MISLTMEVDIEKFGFCYWERRLLKYLLEILMGLRMFFVSFQKKLSQS